MIPMRGARRDYQLASVEHRPARVASLGAVFDLGEHWRCQCGVEHSFGMYAAAHWQLELVHTCACDRERTFEAGMVISCD